MGSADLISDLTFIQPRANGLAPFLPVLDPQDDTATR